MKTSLNLGQLHAYIVRLLGSYLPDGEKTSPLRDAWIRSALDRVEHCFGHIRRKYYVEQNETRFDHLNADHMAAFLWFLGNTVWRDGGEDGLAVRLSYLNKVMHGLDLFYSVPMPDIFALAHPVGSVIGRGTFGDYLVVYQQVTIGAAESGGPFPSLGEGVAMFAGSSVLGNCEVGNDVVFAANAMIVGKDVPSGSMVVGQFPRHRILKNDLPVRQRCFD